MRVFGAGRSPLDAPSLPRADAVLFPFFPAQIASKLLLQLVGQGAQQRSRVYFEHATTAARLPGTEPTK